MVEEDTYCPEVMKQLSAVQGSVGRASRLVLRNHLEMEALRYDRTPTAPQKPRLVKGASA